MTRGVIAAFLALLLSGCWLGTAFYTLEDASRPIPPGLYQIVDQYPARTPEKGERDKRIRITAASDGSTNFAEGEDSSPVLLVQLTGEPGRFIGQAKLDEHVGDVPAPMLFILAEIRPGGFRLSLPICREDSEAIRPFDIKIEGSITPGCVFPDVATLEAAMKIFAEKPDNWIELQRVGD